MTKQMTKISLNKNTFNEIFYDDFNNHGFQICGVSIEDLYESDIDETNAILNQLPNEIKSKNMNLLIKADNLKSFIVHHILMNQSMNEKFHQTMIDIIKQNEPHKIVENELDFDYMNDFTDFMYDELIKTADLKINNQKIYMIDYSNDELSTIKTDIIKKYYDNKK